MFCKVYESGRKQSKTEKEDPAMTGNSTHENVLLHDAHMCQAKIHLSGVHGSYPKLLTSGTVTLFSHVSYQTINTRLIFVKHSLTNSPQSCLEQQKKKFV